MEMVDVVCCGLQACYSLASAQRRSRAAESGQPQTDEHALHMEPGGPVFHDMQQVLHPPHLAMSLASHVPLFVSRLPQYSMEIPGSKFARCMT